MNLKEYKDAVARICEEVSKLPQDQQETALQVELAKLPAKYRDTALQIATAARHATPKKKDLVQKFTDVVRSNRITAGIIIVVLIIAGVGTLCDNIGKIKTFWSGSFGTSTNSVGKVQSVNVATRTNAPSAQQVVGTNSLVGLSSNTNR